MIKEQEEVIERLRYLIIDLRSSRKVNKIITEEGKLNFVKDLETVLNMLKEKDKDINRKNSTIKALQCALHERTEERDRKDYIIARQKKQIDLMAEHIQNGCDFDNRIKTKKDIKQYFKSKAEKE